MTDLKALNIVRVVLHLFHFAAQQTHESSLNLNKFCASYLIRFCLYVVSHSMQTELLIASVIIFVCVRARARVCVCVRVMWFQIFFLFIFAVGLM